MEAAIGIIGLSLQVIDTSIKIKKAIDCYRSAFKDSGRLAANIDQAEAICGAIETRLQDGSRESQTTSLLRLVGPSTLQRLDMTLKELHEILCQLESQASKKGGLKTSGLSCVRKKDDIQKLGKQLDEDLSLLQHLMTADVL